MSSGSNSLDSKSPVPGYTKRVAIDSVVYVSGIFTAPAGNMVSQCGWKTTGKLIKIKVRINLAVNRNLGVEKEQ